VNHVVVAVLVYHVDRLTRRPLELEQFLEVVTAANVRYVRFVAGGDLDVGNGDGLMVLRLLAAVAANESATKSRRVSRKMEQRAQAGLPGGGYHRPFGYAEDKVTVREDEAAVIRTLGERYLAGESLRSLATWLDQQGVRTVDGGPWRTTTLRAMLSSGRIAGLRDHHGQVIAQAVWAPIISEQVRGRILARMTDLAVSGRRTPRRYLLSGLARCGKCGNTLYSSARRAHRRYVCLGGPDHATQRRPRRGDGCGERHAVSPIGARHAGTSDRYGQGRDEPRGPRRPR
jgi:site-specific DNA recombinase